MISAYPKIFTIGTDYIKDIFNEEVEITEKVDGSQFAFGKINNEICMRSKGARLYPEHHQKMFNTAVDYIAKIQDKLPEDKIFYVEYLAKNKHNTIAYNRIPKNNMMLFGIIGKDHCVDINIIEWAKFLDIESVPILYNGKVNDVSFLKDMLNIESVLGNSKIEGIVVKNYSRAFLLGGQPIPLMAGKFVREEFKERNIMKWNSEKPKNKLESFFDSFKSEARWHKAVQHLKESDSIENSPRDIGKLISEIQNDIEIEEKEMIKDFLYREFIGQLKRRSTAGFAEWYKNELLKRSFE